MQISFKKSWVNKAVILPTEAPKTFRMPTSLVRSSVVNVTKLNNPKQETKIVRKSKGIE